MTRVAQDHLLALIEAYAPRYPAEAAVVADFADFVRREPACCERTTAQGHLTGSSWLVSGDGARVLLTHHRKLGRWLQLGGHADGDHDLARVALREAEEESGLTGLRVRPRVFDLDRHWIPARGEVEGHWHYDVRFVVEALASEAFAVSEESLALAWLPIAGIAADASADESLRRMAGKWLAGDGAAVGNAIDYPR
jgi:8-oxo-dGTP pyrophosphatase MutT (NUDIX family)